MDKIIPILPCPDIKKQVEFYQYLGFEAVKTYTSPNPYAVLKYGTIELHFYGSRKMEPTANSTMCYISVEDVDAVYEAFASGLKTNTNSVPRSGIPRISKVRDLNEDRRFTLTDPGGNTFYIGSSVNRETVDFFRTLQNAELTQKFSVLYDLLYSKEDPKMAEGMLPKLLAQKDNLSELDQAKLLLVAVDIRRHLKQPVEDGELQSLLAAHQSDGDGWEQIRTKFQNLLQDE